jgi:hypothetical protein
MAHYQLSKRRRHPDTLVIALVTLVFLVAAFIFKIHVVDLPKLESSHQLPNRPFPELGEWPTKKSPRQNPPRPPRLQRSPQRKKKSTTTTRTQQKVDPDKQQIFNILENAGYDVANDERFDQEMLDSLPKWSDIIDMYGEPNIIGLETCQQYRESVQEHQTLAVAGNFNSGTNFLYELLRKNCMGITLWQVPW